MKAALLALLVYLAAAPSMAADQPPRIVTTLDPADGVAVVGQPVRMHVRVMFAGDMAHPPLVDVPEAPGAQIMRFESQALTVRDQIDDQAYVGKDFTFVVYPRRAGDITVPPPRIILLDRSGANLGELRGEATRLHVSAPPGVDASKPVLVSDQVQAAQEWSPDNGQTPVAVGGAIVRTIHRSAIDTPSMAMADFNFVAPAGVRVYVDAPVSDDRLSRGDVEGRRTDKVTYVFEKPGRYVLPALTQPWWSPQRRAAQTLTLPGVEVTVAAAAVAPPDDPQALFTHRRLFAIVCLMLGVLGGGLLTTPLLAQWRIWRTRRRATPAWARRVASQVARTGNAVASWQALSLWLGRIPDGEAARLRRDPLLAPALAELERALFGGGAWSKAAGMDLAKAIYGCRRSSSSAPGVNSAGGPFLPPLNP